MRTLEQKVSIQIRLHFRDFLGAYRLYRAAATKEKATHVIIGFVLLLSSALYFSFPLLRPAVVTPEAGDLTTIIWGLALVFGVIYIFDLPPIVLSWILFRQYIQEYPEPYQLTFEESGIRFTSQKRNAIYEWNFYKEAIEGKTIFILLYGKGLHSTIPKSAFQIENEMDIFRTMLKEHLTNFRQELRI